MPAQFEVAIRPFLRHALREVPFGTQAQFQVIVTANQAQDQANS